MGDIDVIILCGGQGSRLKKVVNDRPKPMADIKGRPFLDILIRYAAAFGLRRFILCTGYKADYIEAYYKHPDNPYSLSFSREAEPLGTGGAIKNAEPIIRSNPFLVMNGDSFCPADVKALIDFHQGKKAVLSVVVSANNNAEEYGSILLDDQCRITAFKEKRVSGRNLINAGIYLMDKSILTKIPSRTPYSLENNLFPALAGQNFFGFFSAEDVIDIGTPDRYLMAQRLL